MRRQVPCGTGSRSDWDAAGTAADIKVQEERRQVPVEQEAVLYATQQAQLQALEITGEAAGPLWYR